MAKSPAQKRKKRVRIIINAAGSKEKDKNKKGEGRQTVKQIGKRTVSIVCPGCKEIGIFDIRPISDGKDYEGKCPSCNQTFPSGELPAPIVKRKKGTYFVNY